MTEIVMDHRYCAHIVVEADTPLSNSSGKANIFADSLVACDANGLPILMGSSLTGVTLHQLENSKYLAKSVLNTIFGYQSETVKEDGQGSRIIFSHAHIVDENGKVIEGLHHKSNWSNYLKKLVELPVRQHCRINHKGTADKQQFGKFDTQIVPKGLRFKFLLELRGTKEDEAYWQKIIEILSHPSFRIGGGTRKGFGKLRIITELSQQRIFDLNQDLDAYLNITCSLNESLGANWSASTVVVNTWQKYTLCITPESTWLFSSGFSDKDVDMVPVYETIVVWQNNAPQFSERKILVPATSLKGAISHRVAYHYNRLSKKFADEIAEKDFAQHVGENNLAVLELFGCAKDSKNQGKVGCAKDSKNQGKNGLIGRVILSDLFFEKTQQQQVFNHVALDPFTGGAIDGALFQEKVICQQEEFIIEIYVDKNAFVQNENIEKAWEKTLEDITKGKLALGGGTMRGHGIFSGTISKN